jgi:F-type H+-transporting ATPase subunit b
LQQYAASLAVEQAARRLVITAETDRLLVQNFAQRLGEGGKGGEN